MKPKLRQPIILREEFDNYAFLHDPDTRKSYVLNPVGVFICRRLDGTNEVASIATAVKAEFAGASRTASKEIAAFVAGLKKAGLLEGAAKKKVKAKAKPRAKTKKRA